MRIYAYDELPNLSAVMSGHHNDLHVKRNSLYKAQKAASRDREKIMSLCCLSRGIPQCSQSHAMAMKLHYSMTTRNELHRRK